MTERDCLRKGNWTKIKYYPVSVEKLKQATMREAAYFIAPVNIGEDYEYFDEVKKFLIIPEEPKTLEELKKEFENTLDDLLVKTKGKFAFSKERAEYKFKLKCDQANSRFEFAKRTGAFSEYLSGNVSISNGIIPNSYLSVSNSALSWGTEFNLNPSKNNVGYYCVEPDVKFHMTKRPNKIVQFFMRSLLNFKWVDGK